MTRKRVVHISLLVGAVAALVADIAQHGVRPEVLTTAVLALVANLREVFGTASA